MDGLSTPLNRSIIGASGLDDSSDTLDAATPQNISDPNDLPLIVWLRGDEAFIDDFCLDADAAMKALGIKRSRLTQISGRELRVGRLRVDRYTRPVYRTEDIEAYKGWTRATASHLRASSVINEAATKLEEQSKDLSDQLKTIFLGQIERIEEEISNLRSEVLNQRQSYMSEARSAVDSTQEAFLGHINKNYDEIRIKFDSLISEVTHLRHHQRVTDEGLRRQDKIAEDVKLLCLTLAEVQTQVLDNQQSQLNAQTVQAQFNRDLGKALSMILQFQREAMRKSDENVEMTKTIQTELRQSVAEQQQQHADRPKRKLAFALRRRMARKMI